MKTLKCLLSLIALAVLSTTAHAQFTIVPLKSAIGTVSGSNVISGPTNQVYAINIVYVEGIAPPAWYLQAGYPLYSGSYLQGNYTYGDNKGQSSSSSNLWVTKYTPTEIDGYTRTVYNCPLSTGIWAFYDTAYVTIQYVTVNNVNRTKVNLTIKNYKGQVCLQSSGYLN